jgi:hypothetical protein
MRHVTQPDGDGYCLRCHRADIDAGEYVELGISKQDELLYLCAVHTVELVREAGQLVPLEEHAKVTARLTDANNRIVELEEQARDAAKTEQELQHQLAYALGQLDARKIDVEILTARVEELKRDPAALSRQALLDQIRAAALTNGGSH